MVTAEKAGLDVNIVCYDTFGDGDELYSPGALGSRGKPKNLPSSWGLKHNAGCRCKMDVTTYDRMIYRSRIICTQQMHGRTNAHHEGAWSEEQGLVLSVQCDRPGHFETASQAGHAAGGFS